MDTWYTILGHDAAVSNRQFVPADFQHMATLFLHKTHRLDKRRGQHSYVNM